MTDVSTPSAAESPTSEVVDAPTVKVLLTWVEGADLDAALAVVRRQVYEPRAEVVLVGGGELDSEEEVTRRESLEEAIAEEGEGVDFYWILHSDARPRPDALGALVAEVIRNDASLGGSKLLWAASHDELESVGSATDVFGEPYEGLDEGEIDLQQYDVVREVAFVRSASVLVRRDLAQGLRGFDPKLPPIAAGLDFSQRTRLAGGRVISVPSSEVYHQGRCEEHVAGWREQAGRLRAMLTAYSLLTLLWLVPYDLLVSVLDSLGSLLLLRWRPLVRHLLSWSWNVFRLPSTIGQRRRFKPVRAAGDEELFRFQARGSVRLREVGSELTSRILSLFDDDQALARGSRRVWASPGIWGAFVAAILVAFAVRSFVFVGVPNVGFSFPFEAPSVALDRFMAGWNQSGLGTPASVHPSVGLSGLLGWLALGAEGAARTLTSIGFGFAAIVGLGRLAGRLGLRGPGRYLGGLVALTGPGVALLTGAGSWLALGAAATLPWAVRSVMDHRHDAHRHVLTRYGWALFPTLILVAFSPALVVVPLLFALVWRVGGGKEPRFLVGLFALSAAVVAVPFVLGDSGWLLDAERRLGLAFEDIWPAVVAIVALPLLFVTSRARRLGFVGALFALSAMVLSRAGVGGPGIEEAVLVVASFGAGLVVAAGADRFAGRWQELTAVAGALVVLAMSIGPLVGGRLGLPAGDVNETLAFSETLAGPEGPGRLLIASTERTDIPGEARSGPGFWYRVVDGLGVTHDQAWLGEPRFGDEVMAASIDQIATGAELRPGEALAPFAVDWIVLEGPEFSLDDAFVAQIDLVPTPLAADSRVFENPGSVPLADGGTEALWVRQGTGFSGEAGGGRVTLALNHSDGWAPEPGAIEWWTSVAATNGVADFSGLGRDRTLALISVGLLVGSILMIAVGRSRS